MDTFALITGIFAAIAILALIKANRDTRYFLALESHKLAEEQTFPLISIIVTARNEQTHLESSIQGLLAQDYPELEIILVNDRSTDETQEIAKAMAAQDGRIKCVDIEELPPGWLGKNHACHRGQEQAQGEWILFCDADIQFEPKALQRAVSYAQAQQLDHLTILPEYRAPSLALSVLSSAAVNILLAGTRAADIAIHSRKPQSKDRTRGRVLGIGAFNLVRASIWSKSSGFETIKAEVLDDMGVAWLMKQAKAKTDWLWSKHEISVVWYPQLFAMYNGLKKSFWAGCGYRPTRLIFQGLGLFGLATSPWICLALIDYRVCVTLGSITAGILLRVGYRRARRGYQSFLNTLLAPLGQAGLGLMMFFTAIQGIFKPHLNWRETEYSFEMLRKSQVVWNKRR